MPYQLNYVPDEVRRVESTGIFDLSYTHITSHLTRKGVEQTGKLMAPRIALANGIVPFLGEPDWKTYLFRAYYISLSRYGNGSYEREHSWHCYLQNTRLQWTPEASKELISFFETEKMRVKKEPYCLADFKDPNRILDMKISLEGCIELEQLKQEKYPTLSPEEQGEIKHPEPELYGFGTEVSASIARGTFGQAWGKIPHPFVPAEINLRRYLKCMFTSLDVGATHEWISGIVGRDVPVASLDALATWEEMNGMWYGNQHKVILQK